MKPSEIITTKISAPACETPSKQPSHLMANAAPKVDGRAVTLDPARHLYARITDRITGT